MTPSFRPRRFGMVRIGSVSARAVLLLSVFSGGLALTYEVIWTRHLLNLFGSTTTATAAMLAAFMAGMALGAWTMGRWSVTLRRPLLVYAVIEIGLGIYGLVFGNVVNAAGGILPAGSIAGPGGLDFTLPIRFLGHLVVLLLPTTLMGATLPALAAAIQAFGAEHPRYLAQVYGLNTLGGVLGAFATGFWILPTLGLAHSQSAAAVGAATVAAAAVALDRLRPSLSTGPSLDQETQPLTEGTFVSPRVLKFALLLSGFAALGYEIVWTRVLVLVMGSSTYAFTMMLGTYLAGLAIGSLWIGRYLDRLRAPATALQHIQLGVALAAVTGIAVFPYLPTVALAGFANFGASPWALGAVNALVAAILVLFPTVFLGAALPLAARLMQRGPPRRGRELGTAFAWVSAGHVGGILGTAFVIIPAVGLQGGVVSLASLNVAAAVLLWIVTRQPKVRRNLAVPAGVVVLAMIGWLLPPWNVNIMTSGVYRQAPTYLNLLGSWQGLRRAFAQYRTLFYREGKEAVVAVFERPTLSDRPHIVLTLDGKVDASTGADMTTQVLSGHLPMLYRPDARRALVVGLASGVTVGALTRYPLERIDVVEIEGAVVEASRAFDTFSGAPLKDSRIRVIIEDGRQYLRFSGENYDIIVSEPSNPWLSSSARLFTREFFDLARSRLTSEGVFVQWVPLYGLNESQFRTLLRTLLDVFPDAEVFRVGTGDLLVVASGSQRDVTPKALEAIFKQPLVRGDLERLGIRSKEALIALWVADRVGLSAVVGDGPLNTDDNGLIEFGSPWYVLRDTKAENVAVLERATSASAIASRLVANWTLASDSLAKIAHLHLTAGHNALVQALAEELRARGNAAGDILLGDRAANEGDLSTAASIWRRHEGPQVWARLAELELRQGNPQGAAALYERLGTKAGSPEVLLGYGLALGALGEHQDALVILDNIRPKPDSVPGLVAPLLRAYVLDQLGRNAIAAEERKRFTAGVDHLRTRLEVERGQELLDALLQWIDAWRTGLPPRVQEELKTTVRQRITGPLPAYYRGVSLLWLGEYSVAEASFKAYLRMLPDVSVRSKVHELLILARRQEAAH